MINNWTMLGIGTLICIGAFANGVRFARRPADMAERFPGGGRAPLSPRAIGRVFMVAAPLFWLLWAAVWLGFLGPVPNIQTIQLH